MSDKPWSALLLKTPILGRGQDPPLWPLLKVPSSNSHILRSWGSGNQHKNFQGEAQFSPLQPSKVLMTPNTVKKKMKFIFCYFHYNETIPWYLMLQTQVLKTTPISSCCCPNGHIPGTQYTWLTSSTAPAGPCPQWQVAPRPSQVACHALGAFSSSSSQWAGWVQKWGSLPTSEPWQPKG